MMVRRREPEPDEELTPAQEAELTDAAGWIMAAKMGSTFGSEEARRRAWEAHRGRLLREYVDDNPGQRPPAWWEYDAPRDRPVFVESRPAGAPRDLGNEAAVLLEMGELGEQERGRCPPPTPAERAYIEANENPESPEISED